MCEYVCEMLLEDPVGVFNDLYDFCLDFGTLDLSP